jgi:predicted naringenin-chalcone synthase
MIAVGILGLATALPSHRTEQPEAARFASLLSGYDEEEAKRASILYRRSGVQRRHFAVLDIDPVGGEHPHDLQKLFQATSNGHADAQGPTTADRMAYYAQRAAPLAERAARRALNDAGLPTAAITHLVTVSCTGFTAPGVDIALIRCLGLSANVERTHIGFMGCQGALNGLRVATSLVRSSPAAHVLLCAVELCGLHFQYSGEPDAVVANSLFADGAAAAVLGAANGGPRWRVAGHGAGLIPDTLDAMTWTIGNHGFTMTLSPQVPGYIEEHLCPWIETWLCRHELTIGDVGSWAIHPGGARIVSAVERALGLDAAAGTSARAVLAEHGNMSSPTVLFVLKRLIDARAPRPCVAIAFGPGLSVEAALLT